MAERTLPSKYRDFQNSIIGLKSDSYSAVTEWLKSSSEEIRTVEEHTYYHFNEGVVRTHDGDRAIGFSRNLGSLIRREIKNIAIRAMEKSRG